MRKFWMLMEISRSKVDPNTVLPLDSIAIESIGYFVRVARIWPSWQMVSNQYWHTFKFRPSLIPDPIRTLELCSFRI